MMGLMFVNWQAFHKYLIKSTFPKPITSSHLFIQSYWNYRVSESAIKSVRDPSRHPPPPPQGSLNTMHPSFIKKKWTLRPNPVLCFVFLALGWPRFLPGRRVKDVFAALESPSFVVFLACARLRWPPRLRSAQRGHARERAARAAWRAGPPRTVEPLLARRRPPPPAPPPPLLPPRVVCGIPGGTEGVLPGPGPDRQLGGRERGCSQACARGRRLRSSPRARARPEDPRSAWALSGRGLGLGRARGGGGGGGGVGGNPGTPGRASQPRGASPTPAPLPLPRSASFLRPARAGREPGASLGDRSTWRLPGPLPAR